MSYVLLNGCLIERINAVVSVDDLGFLYGDGLFVTLRLEEGQILGYQEQIKKFEQGCYRLCLIPPTICKRALFELIEKNQATHGIWRLKILATAAKSLIHSTTRACQTCLVHLDSFLETPNEVSVITYQAAVEELSSVKTLAYLSRFWIARQAKERGADEAIVLSKEGFVTEGAFHNLFWTVDQILYLPSPTLPFYQGIGLNYMIKAAQHLSWQIKTISCKPQDIPKNAQIFLCNALRGPRAVTAWDGKGCSSTITTIQPLIEMYWHLMRQDAILYTRSI